MASRSDVDRALRDLVDRLHAVDAGTRGKLAIERTVSCRVPDLDVVYRARWAGGEVCDVTTDGAGPAQVRLEVASDDLVDLVEGRLSVPLAWAAGRLQVDASVLDLLKLRMLL